MRIVTLSVAVFAACAITAIGAARNTQAERDAALYEATYDGNPDAIQALLRAGANVEMRDKNGETPLCNAAARGHMEAVQLLLAAGADVNGKCWAERRPLYFAALSGDAELVKLLLARGAVLDAKDHFGDTALMEAGSPEAARVLLAAGADVNVVGDEGATALGRAEDVEIVRVLLAAGAKPPERSKLNESFLRDLKYHQFAHETAWFLVMGAEVNAAGPEGETPLITAVRSSIPDIDSIRLLLASGADANARDAHGRTAAEYAEAEGLERKAPPFMNVYYTWAEIAEVVHAFERSRASPVRSSALLFAAAYFGDEHKVAQLLASGADPNSPDVLQAAAENGHAAIVGRLLAAGTKVDASNRRGETALSLAASKSRVQVVRVLLAAGADPNQKWEGGRFPLFHAAFMNSVPVAQALLDAGANINQRDDELHTALIVAKELYSGEVARFLRSRGARESPADADLPPVIKASADITIQEQDTR